MRLRQAGRSWSPGVKQDLFDMGLSSNSVKTAFENAQALVDNQDMLDAGYVVKDYTAITILNLKRKSRKFNNTNQTPLLVVHHQPQ